MVSIGGGSVGGIIRTNKTKRILKVIKNVGQQYHESFIIKKVGNKISKTLKKYHSGLTVEEKEVKTKKDFLQENRGLKKKKKSILIKCPNLQKDIEPKRLLNIGSSQLQKREKQEERIRLLILPNPKMKCINSYAKNIGRAT